MYIVASKTKSHGLKEYQNYVAHIHSILKTIKQRCGSHWIVVHTNRISRLAKQTKSRGSVFSFE